MPKTANDLRSIDKMIDEAIADFEAVAEVKGMIADDVFMVQDDKTKTILTKIEAILMSRLADGVVLKVGRSKVDAMASEESIKQVIRWMAVELVKDLALVGIQVGNFEFQTDACAVCGGDV